MSSDTGIYIARFPDGYRVTQVVQAIENIDFHRPGTKARKQTLKDYFGDSPVFLTIEDALVYAFEVQREWDKDEAENGMGCPIEYGVCDIGDYEAFEEAK